MALPNPESDNISIKVSYSFILSNLTNSTVVRFYDIVFLDSFFKGVVSLGTVLVGAVFISAVFIGAVFRVLFFLDECREWSKSKVSKDELSMKEYKMRLLKWEIK